MKNTITAISNLLTDNRQPTTDNYLLFWCLGIVNSQTHTHIARWAETGGSGTTPTIRLLRPLAILPDSPKKTEQNHDAAQKYQANQLRFMI